VKEAVQFPQLIRFESFELNLRSGELCKNGERIKLPEQSFQILAMLLERPREVILRQEIQKKLWPNDTVVEFENSINAAIKKLRVALDDSADQPRFIETRARRGYRWIVPVQWVGVSPANLQAPAAGDVPPSGQVAAPHLIGKRVSHYRVLEILGGGGMGVVYKAEDIKLGRRVALKFLPEELADDTAAMERFRREARAASALNHPNICTIYGVEEHEGQPFIVMELLEGQTLRELITAVEAPQPGTRAKKGRLPLQRLLHLAIQIAEGLHAAHKKGIVHRDIKPANIFVTTDGQVKILDFGLAKLQESEIGDQQPTASWAQQPRREWSPYLTLTRTGVAIGTAGYMSPEQVKGEKLDARTDLFSFGLVLYEMAAGQRAFTGETAPILHNAILNRTPTPARELNPEIPPKLEVVINKALMKNRALRYQAASEMHADFENLQLASKPRRPGPRRSAIAASTFAMLAVVGVIFRFAKNQPSFPPGLPEIRQRQLTANSSENPVSSGAISPDGKYLAYVDLKGIHLKLIQTGEARTVTLPQILRESYVDWDIKAWFPDSTRFLATAFIRGLRPSIWTVPVMGGLPRKLRDNATAWAVSPDGTQVVFTTGPGSIGDREIWLMSPDGERAGKLYETDEQSDFERIEWSPDGQRLAYDREHRAADKVEEILETRDLKGGPAQAILTTRPYWEKDGLRDFLWLRDGRLIYALTDPDRNGPTCNYWEMQVDARTVKSRGVPRRLTDWAGFCLDQMSATEDGKRLTFTRFWGQNSVYVADLAANGTRISTPRHLTLSDGQEIPIAWSADSKAVVFESNRNGPWGIFRQSLDDEMPEPIVPSIAGRSELDGRMLRLSPHISSDGTWVFYPVLSERGGTLTAFQLMRVPAMGGPSQLVLTAPVCSTPRCARSPATLCVIDQRVPDGSQLIFRAFDQSQGRGRELARFDLDPNVSYNWDVSSDGTRIAIVPASKGTIHILSLRGQASQVIAVRGWSSLTSLDWAADARGMFASSPTSQGSVLLYIDLQGDTHVLWEQRGHMATYAVPSPDGRRVAISGWSGNSNLWMMENF